MDVFGSMQLEVQMKSTPCKITNKVIIFLMFAGKGHVVVQGRSHQKP